MTSTILIPSSVVREATDKRDATRKLGTIARAATIFGIDRIGVFSDPEGEGRWGAPFITRVLRYAATPASDRTRRWDIHADLEFAGVLPPMQPSAEAGSGSQGPGSLIDGIVTEVGSEGRVWVNCELQHPLALIAPPEVDRWMRATAPPSGSLRETHSKHGLSSALRRRSPSRRRRWMRCSVVPMPGCPSRRPATGRR